MECNEKAPEYTFCYQGGLLLWCRNLNYIYQYLINKKITNYNISNFTNNFTKKVDLIYTEIFDFKKITSILNKDGILIIKNNITLDNINLLKKHFRLIGISNILNFTNKFIICYNYQSKFEMNNNLLSFGKYFSIFS